MANNGLRSRNIYDSAEFKPYPLFEAIVYDITYIMNGGTNDPSNPDTYTIEDDTITLSDPTRDRLYLHRLDADRYDTGWIDRQQNVYGDVV